MKTTMTTASVMLGGVVWADQLVTVVRTLSVLVVVTFGMAIWALLRSPDAFIRMLWVLFGRGRDPDPDHPPDRRRDPE